MYVVSEALELMLVGSQGHLLLDHALVGPDVTAQLALAAAQDCSTLRSFSVASLAEDFLPGLMPAEWRSSGRGQVAGGVSELPPSGDVSDAVSAPLVTWEWLQALWQWLAAGPRRPDWPLLARSGWPVLPAADGALVPLAPEPSRCSTVLPGADWPSALQPVLQKLGVSVLDTAAYELPVDALLAGGYVRSGCGGGVALALQAALGPSDYERMEELAPAERRLLRSYLVQPIWFQQRGGGNGRGGAAAAAGASNNASAAADPSTLAAILRQLPIYELANDGSFSAASAAAAGGDDDADGGSSSDGGAGTEQPPAFFVPLQPGCEIAPHGILSAALDERFVNAGPPGGPLATVLAAHLKISAPTAPEVYRSSLLPRLGALEPALRDAAVLALLRSLPALEAQDAAFVRGLKQVRMFCQPSNTDSATPLPYLKLNP